MNYVTRFGLVLMASLILGVGMSITGPIEVNAGWAPPCENLIVNPACLFPFDCDWDTQSCPDMYKITYYGGVGDNCVKCYWQPYCAVGCMPN